MRRFPVARSSNGSALVETALVLPLILLLMLNTVNFGIYIFAWITMDNAARAAASYAAYNGVVVNFPGSPTFAQIQALVNADVSRLPNYVASTNPTLKVCKNTNGVITCNGTGSFTPAADPNPTRYTIFSADVAYTFTPVFSSFTFPYVNISLTLPVATLHRQVVMRSMQ